MNGLKCKINKRNTEEEEKNSCELWMTRRQRKKRKFKKD